MSLRLEMLQVARLAPKLLGESAGLVRDFLRGQQNDDGGFKDRTGRSDLYYTVFGIDGLLALQAEFSAARLADYLRSFGAGEELDFVHLCCLARGWAALADARLGIADKVELVPSDVSAGILRRVEEHRAKDGGYHPQPGNAAGTAYGAFLALGAYQDFRAELPEPLRLVQSLKRANAADVRIIEMAQGQKKSRILAWSFLTAGERGKGRDGLQQMGRGIREGRDHVRVSQPRLRI